jgi:hypothetical protein
VVKKNVP